ncbi:MAG: hypothetical protein KDN20_17060 [Verrucomicrobiae bacterium]|nr:hypothetical protein [Verrucomicrobiae bacterium]
MERNLRNLRANCGKWLAEQNPDAALGAIEELVRDVWRNPLGACRVFSSPELDDLLMEIGGSISSKGARADISEIAKADQIFVATSVSTAGGHTGVIEDLIRLGGGRDQWVLLTDPEFLRDAELREQLERRFADLGARLLCVPGDRPSEKVAWLQCVLKEFSSAKVWLFNHWWDAVSVAAFVPVTGARQYFCHHADHHLSLGLHLGHMRHVDLSPFSYHHCQKCLGIDGNVYLPLTLSNPPQPGVVGHRKNERITATSGSWFKFSAPYAWHLPEILPGVLRASGGSHMHIGSVPPEGLEAIHGTLRSAGIAMERFIHVQHVDSLGGFFAEQGVDLYFQSFPYPGIKSGIEAMAAGIPIAVHLNYQSTLQASVDMVYPEAFRWRLPENLYQIVQNLDDESLQVHRVQSREWFEKSHGTEVVAKLLDSDFSLSSTIEPPVTPEMEIDRLQLFLDRESQFQDLEVLIERHLGKIEALKAKAETLRSERDRYRDLLRAAKADSAPSGRKGLAKWFGR